MPVQWAPTPAHLQLTSPFVAVHQPSIPLASVPAGLQVYGLFGSAGVAIILFQLQTSPPQTMPPPGQSVSLKQPSPAANAEGALNSATEPTNVASEPRKKAFIRITSGEHVAQPARGDLLATRSGLQFASSVDVFCEN